MNASTPVSNSELQRGVQLFNDLFRESAATQGVDLLLYGMAIGNPSPDERQLDYLVLPRNGPRMKVQIETGLFIAAARDAAATAPQLHAECNRVLDQITALKAA